MAISKNNPDIRSNEKLVIYCSKCEKILKTVMVVNEKGKKETVYKCECGCQYPVYKGSYKLLKYEWIKK